MQATIIIPHYDDLTRLRKCLSALMPQLADRSVEVVVVDNASSQDIAPIRQDFPDVTFHVEPCPGAAAARNRGVRETTAPWLFFTDADCVPAPDWVATALTLGGTPTTIGGRVAVFDETPPPRSGAEAFENVFAFPQKEYVAKKHFSVTANLLTTRAVFEAVGDFDGSVVEDSDWCLRARAKGYPIAYHDELVVAHPSRQDWTALRKKWRRITSENYFAGGTTPYRRLLWGLRCLPVLGSVPVHALKIQRHPDLSGLEKRRAQAVLVRLRLVRCGWILRQALFSEAPINRPVAAGPAAPAASRA